MQSNNLKLYWVDKDYIDYLRSYESRVAIEHGKVRPYVGIVIEINGLNYYAPLTSLKSRLKKGGKIPKDFSMDYVRIPKYENGTWLDSQDDNNLLAGINLNCMIPVAPEVLNKINPYQYLYVSNTDDRKYGVVLKKEIKWISQPENINVIRKKAMNLYKFVSENRDKNFSNTYYKFLYERCCDFKLLEEKMKNYPQYKAIQEAKKEVAATVEPKPTVESGTTKAAKKQNKNNEYTL